MLTIAGGILLALLAFLALGGLLVRLDENAYWKRVRAANHQDAKRRAAHEAVKREQAQKARKDSEVRNVARERARLAFPDLLNGDEAKGFDDSHPGMKELSAPDYDLIYEARKFVREAIEVIKAANPDWRYSSPVGEKLAPLNEDLSALESADEDRGYRELDLGTPARIIDCGAAGQVNLYAAAVVMDARKQAGIPDYLAFLDRRARAPKLAMAIVKRARLAEQKEREAEEARLASITTKLEDLPPLPSKED
jgi:hypothetical protein